jgi:hypothetical protein
MSICNNCLYSTFTSRVRHGLFSIYLETYNNCNLFNKDVDVYNFQTCCKFERE